MNEKSISKLQSDLMKQIMIEARCELAADEATNKYSLTLATELMVISDKANDKLIAARNERNAIHKKLINKIKKVMIMCAKNTANFIIEK